jgi:hypothetical protein
MQFTQKFEQHFALCNGRRLAVYGVDSPQPLLDLPFEEFEVAGRKLKSTLHLSIYFSLS